MLEIRKLSKQFVLHTQKSAVLPVLDQISLHVNAGEIAALCGPSGVGKSSLLKAIYGSYRVNDGEILVNTVDGVTDVASCDPRAIVELRKHRIGYVSQFLRVIPRVATLDIVSNSAIEAGEEKAAAQAKAAQLLERLNIAPALHSLSPLTFSGGEQQRVNIARAMAAPRPLMLFDEPTASLDPKNRSIVLDMIKDMAANGSAVLGIFHAPADRAELGAREINMNTRELIDA